MRDLNMKLDGMAQIEQNRKKLSIKAMYFNRYLLVRYVSALFFFVNLYWLISLVMSDSSLYFIPLLLIIALVISTVEQVKMYGNHTNDAKLTTYSFRVLLYTNVILLVPTCISSSFTQLYPFFIDQVNTKIFVLAILTMGILISGLILRRLNKIKQNEDKHYNRIKEFEKAIK